MIESDVPNHHRRVLVDLSFTRVIASRVGTSVVQVTRTGEFGFVRRERPPRDVTATTADGGLRGFPPGRLREFTLQELRNATDNFKGVIGRGGFGETFWGTLADGTSVAIKVWNQDSGQGIEEFKAELRVGRAISSGSHPCLLPVIGYHFSMRRLKSRAMIVYAFMGNGDVGCYTNDRQLEQTPLDWPTRKRIALGVARGIRNLHELGIVHRDIKPTNFMLDEYFEPHLGDFGLAKSTGLPRHKHDIAGVPSDEDSDHCDTTRLCGTMGYLAPEVYSFEGHYSRKSDVFGFGVTLIQLVTGKPAIDRTEEGTNQSIVYRTVQLLKNGEDLMRHMHPGMLGKYDEDEAFELIRLGLICTEYDPKKRPLMPEVIAIMEGSVDTLKQRWDNYNYDWINQLSSAAANQITGSGDVDEMPNASDFDTDEEEFRENDADMIRSQGNRRGRQTSELETELSEMRDQMLAMELNHQAEMEEMRRKQTELMQSMEKMREQHMQQVKEMQDEMDRFRGSAEL